MPLPWFDAHLDLAYLAVCGRDMLAPLDPAAAPHPPSAVTLPSLVEGNVRFALATIFTEPTDPDNPPPAPEPQMYPAVDAARAFAVGRAQLEVYLTWRDRDHIGIDLARLFKGDPGVGEVRTGMGVSQPVPFTPEQRLAKLPAKPPLHIGILMENADPIRSPDDLAWWQSRGVCAVGLAWAKPSRYADGNMSPGGLTDPGRALVKEMDRLGVVHDASHLSDRSLGELLDLTDRPVIASHSNCRALVDGINQRHLTDEAIRHIEARAGVIGVNLFSKFLRRRTGVEVSASPWSAPGSRGPEARATIDDCIAHIDHVCSLVGHTRCIGLGSDMDGGFGADGLPRGINAPRDLSRLADALNARNWSDDDIAGFAWKNWAKFWS